MPSRIPQGSPERLSFVVPGTPDHAADTLVVIASTRVDLGPDPSAVRRQRRIGLSLVVECRNQDVATLAPVRIEPVVLKHPSPDRVVAGIHLRQPTHLPRSRTTRAIAYSMSRTPQERIVRASSSGTRRTASGPRKRHVGCTRREAFPSLLEPHPENPGGFLR